MSYVVPRMKHGKVAWKWVVVGVIGGVLLAQIAYSSYKKRVTRIEREFRLSCSRCQVKSRLDRALAYELNTSLYSNLPKLTILDLRSMLDNREITIQELVVACSRRLREWYPKGLVLDFDIEQALAQAEVLQTELTQGKLRSELHGITLSVQNPIFVSGLAHMTETGEIHTDKTDCALSKVLRDKGCIVLCKGVDSTFAVEHPLKSNRRVPGSAGACSGLVSSGCTPFAIGLDEDCGLNYSAFCCGVYSLRTSRLPQVLSRGYPGLEAHIGLLARSPGDLELIMKELCSPHTFDNCYRIPPVEWDSEQSEAAKYRVGYVLNDSAPAALNRVMFDAVSHLQKGGHHVIPIEIGFAEDLHLSVLKIVCSNYTKLSDLAMSSSLPKSLLKICRFVIEKLKGPVGAFYLRTIESDSAYVFAETQRVQNHSKEALLKLYEDGHLDVVLLPYHSPASVVGLEYDAYKAAHFAILPSALNFPSGNIPISSVQTAEQNTPEDPYNRHINMLCSFSIPLGVQVLALPYQEERCIQFMKEFTGTSLEQ